MERYYYGTNYIYREAGFCKLTGKELLGCLIMFIAVVGVQVFDAKKTEVKEIEK